jgi:hypothetical protein
MPFVSTKLNDHAFDAPLSNEAAYWLGMLLADGCISQRTAKSGKIYHILILGLKEEDSGHVDKFANFMGTSSRGRLFKVNSLYGATKVYLIQISIRDMYKRLNELGIVRQKTYVNQHVSNEVKNSRDFWRGVIDGDGTITDNNPSKHPVVAVCGTRLLVEDFTNITEIVVGKRPTVGAIKSIFRASLSCTKAKEFLSWLYYDDCVALSRKEKTARRILQESMLKKHCNS